MNILLIKQQKIVLMGCVHSIYLYIMPIFANLIEQWNYKLQYREDRNGQKNIKILLENKFFHIYYILNLLAATGPI